MENISQAKWIQAYPYHRRIVATPPHPRFQCCRGDRCRATPSVWHIDGKNFASRPARIHINIEVRGTGLAWRVDVWLRGVFCRMAVPPSDSGLAALAKLFPSTVWRRYGRDAPLWGSSVAAWLFGRAGRPWSKAQLLRSSSDGSAPAGFRHFWCDTDTGLCVGTAKQAAGSPLNRVLQRKVNVRTQKSERTL